MTKNALCWLSAWFESHCDGDWEHSFGVKIETTDNPGWIVEIDLTDTGLEGRVFASFASERSDVDWIRGALDKAVVRIACGTSNLSEAITIFREWVSSEE